MEELFGKTVRADESVGLSAISTTSPSLLTHLARSNGLPTALRFNFLQLYAPQKEELSGVGVSGLQGQTIEGPLGRLNVIAVHTEPSKVEIDVTFDPPLLGTGLLVGGVKGASLNLGGNLYQNFGSGLGPGAGDGYTEVLSFTVDSNSSTGSATLSLDGWGFVNTVPVDVLGLEQACPRN
jgi:hypothetical protein